MDPDGAGASVTRFHPTLCVARSSSPSSATARALRSADAARPARRRPPPRPRRPTRRRSSAASSRRCAARPTASPRSTRSAEFYLQAGKLAAAIPHLERARALDPAHYANGYDLAIAYLETGKLDAARQQVRRMLEAKETAELFNLLGDVDARAGDFVAAAVGYQRAAHLEPTEEHLFDWGDNLLRLRAYDDAVDVFTAEHPPPSDVGPAAHRPRHRAVLARPP